MTTHPCCAGILLAVGTTLLQAHAMPFWRGLGLGVPISLEAGHCGCSFSVGKKLNVVGKCLQESRALVEGLMANLGEDGEGKPAALKHGDAARVALRTQ